MKPGRKLIPILCICWYLVSVTGFDIHFCGDDGCVYLEPLFAGISCETIHPATPCRHSDRDCCDDHKCCDDDEECCHDLIALLDVPGVGSGGSVDVPAPMVDAVLIPEIATVPVRLAGAMEIHACHLHYPPPPALSRLCVLRV